MGMEQGGSYIDEAGEYGGGSDFNIGMGAGGDEFAIDYASVYGGAEPIDFAPIDFAPYEQSWELEPFIPVLENIETSEPGLIPYAPYEQSWPIDPYIEDIGFVETISTSESGLLPDTPFPFYELPYVPEPFLTPYTPIFPDLPEPLPPIVTPLIPLTIPAPPQTPLPTTPTTGAQPIAPGLPPACPTGQYHPYPIGHPQQNACVPFPPAQTGSKPQQQQKPSAASGGAASGGAQQKPQQQQACPTGYCKHPTTGQCIPIPSGYTRHPQTQVCTPAQQQGQCPTGYYPDPVTRQCKPIPKCTTPGTVFDAARGICVPQGQAISPLPMPGEAEDLLSSLKEIPWWIWLAAGGLLLLSRGDDGKTTTVRYKRS